MYAQKIQKRAKAGGLIQQETEEALAALQQNIDGIKAALEKGEDVSELVGQLLFNGVSLAGATKNDAEEVLSFENAKMLEKYKKLDVK